METFPMSSLSPCPHCGRQVSIPQQYWGTVIHSPMCGGQFTAGGPAASAPYGSAAAMDAPPHYGPIRHAEPHRGGLILTLAILGVIICGPMALAAWIMATSDLQKIRHGTMDPSGYGLTLAGLVVGIIGTILWFLGIVILLGSNA